MVELRELKKNATLTMQKRIVAMLEEIAKEGRISKYQMEEIDAIGKFWDILHLYWIEEGEG